MRAKNRWNAVFTAAVLALLALALWQAYAPYAGRIRDIPAIRGSITAITPSALADKLKSAPHPPTLLYVYASWCGTCAVVMPHLAGIIREREYDDVRFIFVSIDQKEINLMDYLVRNRYDGLFVPYIIRESAGDTLLEALAALGGHYGGSIPYMAFFDRRGVLAESISGGAGRDAIVAALEQARR